MTAPTRFIPIVEDAIDKGEIIPGQTRAGDWLRSIPESRLDELADTFDRYMRDAEPKHGEKDFTDVIGVAIMFAVLEKGSPQSTEATFSEDQLIEFTQRMATLCILEQMRRQKFITLEPIGITDDAVTVGPGTFTPFNN